MNVFAPNDETPLDNGGDATAPSTALLDTSGFSLVANRRLSSVSVCTLVLLDDFSARAADGPLADMDRGIGLTYIPEKLK